MVRNTKGRHSEEGGETELFPRVMWTGEKAQEDRKETEVVRPTREQRKKYDGKPQEKQGDGATSRPSEEGKEQKKNEAGGKIARNQEEQKAQEDRKETEVEKQDDGATSRPSEEGKEQRKNDGETKSGTTRAKTAADGLQVESVAKDGGQVEKKGVSRESKIGTELGQQKKSSGPTLTDSTLHRINGDLRISLKTDKPVRHTASEQQSRITPPMSTK
ncbi:hypothetical protein XENOCAPTIV_024655 [Xenoophorus captivus]|uniref:Uncharacterized protein n=1 Tax=Xenoophorus captivus TaxID=1517983 RepID=A0ABV0QWG2_9TELE